MNKELIKKIKGTNSQVALWGASKNNVVIISELISESITPVAIIDNDIGKIGKCFCGIKIYSFDDAISSFSDLYIWIADGNWKYQVIGQLVYELGFPKERILNYEAVVWKRACPYVENGLVCSNTGLQFCCQMSGRKTSPTIRFTDNIVTDLNNFIDYRNAYSKQIYNKCNTICDGCIELKEGYYAESPKINTINYSVGGVCNLKCKYCISSAKESKGTWEKDADFELILKFLANKELLSDILHFDISPGEIALNRNKKNIYSQFKIAQSTTVMTNATIYDEELAKCLAKGEANLCVSVDAGTRETYKKVRGVDLYDKLKNNLIRYSMIAPGLVDLKYIFVPDENDTLEDAEGFAELCSEVKPSAAFLTYDIFNPIQVASEHTIEVLKTMMKKLEDKGVMYKINSEVLRKALNK